MNATDVIIPVHGQLEYTQKCFESVLQNTPMLNRFIIVDDMSDAETTAYLLDILKRHTHSLYLRTGSQRWFTRASNLGLRLVRTQLALLLNSDCVCNPGWLEELYAVWDEAEKQGVRVGLVGSVLSEPEPRKWAQIVEPNFVTGHCLLLNMTALGEASATRGMPGWYFDETKARNAHIFSDQEICQTFRALGYATIASFKSAVAHAAGKSWGYDTGKALSLKMGDPLRGEVSS